jgi:hypothetical protein
MREMQGKMCFEFDYVEEGITMEGQPDLYHFSAAT